ncbi:MAG: LacI family DNA-binding transcriptional regulator [Cyclobacteriaceae bacterium]|nr:LacI family DNA-binding transcriptional regulator [Cyclobacteriaceae bacterium]
MKIYTIKEIAKLSDVSSGTVDRVLHGGGKVSPDKNRELKKSLKKSTINPISLHDLSNSIKGIGWRF